jgi:hypothetical protein
MTRFLRKIKPFPAIGTETVYSTTVIFVHSKKQKRISMAEISFQEHILRGIPDQLPPLKPYDPNINHAPRRKEILHA